MQRDFRQTYMAFGLPLPAAESLTSHREGTSVLAVAASYRESSVFA